MIRKILVVALIALLPIWSDQVQTCEYYQGRCIPPYTQSPTTEAVLYYRVHQVSWNCKLDGYLVNQRVHNVIKPLSGACTNAIDKSHVEFNNGLISFLPKVKINEMDVLFQYISINDTNTTQISEEFFRYYKDLKTFKSSHNKLRIEENSFRLTQHIVSLNLSSNQITHIPSMTFKGLKQLTQLDLSKNGLEFIDPKWFENLDNLKSLFLAENKINTLEFDLFDNLNIRDLDMSNNPCVDINLKNTNPIAISEALAPCHPCQIPAIKNGHILDPEDNSTLPVGSNYSTLGLVKLACTKTYYKIYDREEQNFNLCFNGKWKQTWPTCQNLCNSSDITGISIDPFCKINGRSFHCSGHIFEGSIATLYCKNGYREPPNLIENQLQCLESGKWNGTAWKCLPMCGGITPQAFTLGAPSTLSMEVPWAVNVYKNDIYVCGATLISENVAITTASCFDQFIDGKIDERPYKVVAGKNFKDFHATEHFETQVKNIKEISVPERYYKYHKATDVATIIVEGYFEFKGHVTPACWDSDDYEYEYPTVGSRGSVSGWGDEGELNTASITTIDENECEKRQKNGRISKAICAVKVRNGPSCVAGFGGGLLLSQMRENRKKYFIRGVATTNADCSETETSIFVDIQPFRDLIQDTIDRSILYL